MPKRRRTQPRPTRPDLHKLLAEWQRTLRLVDWDIVAEYSRGFDIPGTLGQCSVNIERNSADIKVLEPGDTPPGRDKPHDAELTLVHELIHVHCEEWAPTDRDSLAYKRWERFIDLLSVILVKLKRGEQP